MCIRDSTRGGLGDVKVKRFLNSVLQEELEPIRQRRKEIAKDIPAVYRILEEGSKKARAKASETLADMKRAMKINYFEDMELIEEQARRFNACLLYTSLGRRPGGVQRG